MRWRIGVSACWRVGVLEGRNRARLGEMVRADFGADFTEKSDFDGRCNFRVRALPAAPREPKAAPFQMKVSKPEVLDTWTKIT